MDWCHCICDNNLLSSACIQLDSYMARWPVKKKKRLRTDNWNWWKSQRWSPISTIIWVPRSLQTISVLSAYILKMVVSIYGVHSFFPWTSYVYNTNIFFVVL